MDLTHAIAVIAHSVLLIYIQTHVDIHVITNIIAINNEQRGKIVSQRLTINTDTFTGLRQTLNVA